MGGGVMSEQLISISQLFGVHSLAYRCEVRKPNNAFVWVFLYRSFKGWSLNVCWELLTHNEFWPMCCGRNKAHRLTQVLLLCKCNYISYIIGPHNNTLQCYINAAFQFVHTHITYSICGGLEGQVSQGSGWFLDIISFFLVAWNWC